MAELAIKKKLPREAQLPSGENLDTNHDCDLAGLDNSDCDSIGKKGRGAGSPISIRSEPDMLPFSKDPSGRFVMKIMHKLEKCLYVYCKLFTAMVICFGRLFFFILFLFIIRYEHQNYHLTSIKFLFDGRKQSFVFGLNFF